MARTTSRRRDHRRQAAAKPQIPLVNPSNKDAGGLHYDYAACIEYADQIGLAWRAQDVPEIDRVFADLRLTQEQVERLVSLHVCQVRHSLQPANYTRRERFAMAFHFIFAGR